MIVHSQSRLSKNQFDLTVRKDERFLLDLDLPLQVFQVKPQLLMNEIELLVLSLLKRSFHKVIYVCLIERRVNKGNRFIQ